MEKLQSRRPLIDGITGYLKNYWYMLSVAVCTVATYGYFLTHYAVSIDDLSADRYYFGELFAQGRFTSTIVHHLFGLVDNSPWIRDLLGLLLLLTSAIVFCVLFDQLITFKTNVPKILFSCLLVSSPIFAELFSYNGTCLSVGGGFLCVSLSLYFTLQSRQTHRIRHLACAAATIAVAASWYESLLMVYVQGVFALLILHYIAAKEPVKFKKLILCGLYFVIPLAIGVLAELLFQTAVIRIFALQRHSTVENTIRLLSLKELKYVLTQIFVQYFLAALWHKAIAILLVSFLLCAGLCLFYGIRKRSFLPVFLFAGLVLSNFLLSFLSVGSVTYRTCQCFGFFVAFTVLLLLLSAENSPKPSAQKLRKLLCVGAAYLLILQISTSNYWYFWDYQRYLEEANTVHHVSVALTQNYDISKPIIFTGNYALSEEILEHSHVPNNSFPHKVLTKLGIVIPDDDPDDKFAIRIPHTIVSSYIHWGMNAFRESGTELFKFFAFHGVDYLKQGTSEMAEEAKTLAEDMPRWPLQGSIRDVGEYIIVNF